MIPRTAVACKAEMLFAQLFCKVWAVFLETLNRPHNLLDTKVQSGRIPSLPRGTSMCFGILLICPVRLCARNIALEINNGFPKHSEREDSVVRAKILHRDCFYGIDKRINYQFAILNFEVDVVKAIVMKNCAHCVRELLSGLGQRNNRIVAPFRAKSIRITNSFRRKPDSSNRPDGLHPAGSLLAPDNTAGRFQNEQNADHRRNGDHQQQ